MVTTKVEPQFGPDQKKNVELGVWVMTMLFPGFMV